MQLQRNEIWGYLQNLTIEQINALWDKPIYHIVKYDYLLGILRDKALTFVNIYDSWWDEPYELCLFRPKYTLKGTALSVTDVAKSHYAQCWSTNRNSNAMWKIYSPKHDSVRIKTTFGKIITLLYLTRTPNGLENVIPYFGKMDYVSQSALKSYVASFQGETASKWLGDIKKSLFLKRNNFRYEHEYRILLTVPTNLDNNQPFLRPDNLKYPIDVHDFIEEITFDPESDSKLNRKRKKEIQAIVGTGIKINKSRLYLHDLEVLNINLI